MHFSKENNHAERWTHDNLYLVLKLDESTRARVKTAALGVYSRGQFLRMFACFALPTNSELRENRKPHSPHNYHQAKLT